MTVTWHRARTQAHTLYCGYCGPRAPFAPGEVYALVQTQLRERPFVRCAACATARWGLCLPTSGADSVAEDAPPPAPAVEPAPSWERVSSVRGRTRWAFDVKARAAGEA